MSYDQSFHGTLKFADAHCLEAGLDAFVAVDDVTIDVDGLVLEGLALTIRYDCSAPASMYDPTMAALSELAAHAKSGTYTATFTMDTTSREHRRAGGRKTSKGLPPRHRRWEMYFAAKTGDTKALRALAKAGVALDQKVHHCTALELAAQAGSVDTVKLLIDAGCSVSGTLVNAANASVARLLVEAGANVDEPSGENVPIEWACYQRRFDVAAVLIEAGVKIPAKLRRDVVFRCAQAGEIATLHALVKHDPKVTRAFTDADVMKAAIRGGEPVLVDFLLEHGAKLPKTFLEDAVASKSLALAETALRAKGAIARCGNSAKRDHAMNIAARNADLPMLKLLASMGVPLYSKTAKQETSPLHAVSYEPRNKAGAACTHWLIDNGVPMDLVDKWGSTPLQAAATNYNHVVVEILLERGANPAELDSIDEQYRQHLRDKLGARFTKLVAKPKAAAKRTTRISRPSRSQRSRSA